MQRSIVHAYVVLLVLFPLFIAPLFWRSPICLSPLSFSHSLFLLLHEALFPLFPSELSLFLSPPPLNTDTAEGISHSPTLLSFLLSCFLLIHLPPSLSTSLPLNLFPHSLSLSSHKWLTLHIKEASVILLCEGKNISTFLSLFFWLPSLFPNPDAATNMFYFQLVIMAGTVLLAYYFEYTDTFPVHIQGFFCFDKAYSKPYPGPEDYSKAPPVLVYSLVTAIPTVTVSWSATYLRKEKKEGNSFSKSAHLSPSQNFDV